MGGIYHELLRQVELSLPIDGRIHTAPGHGALGAGVRSSPRHVMNGTRDLPPRRASRRTR